MNYRYDIAQQRKDETGVSYKTLAERSGLPRMVVWEVVRGKNPRGETNPQIKNIRATFEALDLNPRLALDFNYKLKKHRLKKRQVRRAVVATAR